MLPLCRSGLFSEISALSRGYRVNKLHAMQVYLCQLSQEWRKGIWIQRSPWHKGSSLRLAFIWRYPFWISPSIRLRIYIVRCKVTALNLTSIGPESESSWTVCATNHTLLVQQLPMHRHELTMRNLMRY